MTTTSIVTGDTVRVKTTFTNTSGALTDADPATNVNFRVYDAETRLLLDTQTAGRLSLGVYYYDWTVPAVERSYVFEIEGTFGAKPQLGRKKVKAKFRI